jgi:hypothetical protein
VNGSGQADPASHVSATPAAPVLAAVATVSLVLARLFLRDVDRADAG